MSCKRSVALQLVFFCYLAGSVVRHTVASTEDLPQCSCACCVTQTRGDGNWWGRTGHQSKYACLPYFHGRTSPNKGFADCPVQLGHSNQFCRKTPQDPLLAASRQEQVDWSRFCFAECISTAAEPLPLKHGLIPAHQISRRSVNHDPFSHITAPSLHVDPAPGPAPFAASGPPPPAAALLEANASSSSSASSSSIVSSSVPAPGPSPPLGPAPGPLRGQVLMGIYLTRREAAKILKDCQKPGLPCDARQREAAAQSFKVGTGKYLDHTIGVHWNDTAPSQHGQGIECIPAPAAVLRVAGALSPYRAHPGTVGSVDPGGGIDLAPATAVVRKELLNRAKQKQGFYRSIYETDEGATVSGHSSNKFDHSLEDKYGTLNKFKTAVETALTIDIAAKAMKLEVTSDNGFKVGDYILVGKGAGTPGEVYTITGLTPMRISPPADRKYLAGSQILKLSPYDPRINSRELRAIDGDNPLDPGRSSHAGTTFLQSQRKRLRSAFGL